MFLLLIHVLNAAGTYGEHLRSIGAVHGPLCYNCHGIQQPGACNDVKICSLGEVCMLHRLTSSSGSHSYESSCQSEMMCKMIGQIQMIGKRDDVTCHVCCTDDFCNNKCSSVSPMFPLYNGPLNNGSLSTTILSCCPNNRDQAMTPGTLNSRLSCYSCSLLDHPGSCKHHVTCQLGQMCLIRETGVSTSGGKQYQSSCENKDVCSALQSANVDDSFCVTCCSTELCNDHCQNLKPIAIPTATTAHIAIPTHPKTTSTVKTTIHHYTPATTTFVSGALRCYSCNSMTSPNDCKQIMTCAPGEVCTLNQVMVPGSQDKLNLYQAACEQKSVCTTYADLLKQHFGYGNYCKTCCDTDACNSQCPIAPPNKPTATPTAMTSSPSSRPGITCYSCNKMAHPDACRNTAMCGQGQVCMLWEHVAAGPNSRQFSSLCMDMETCSHYSRMLGEVSKTDRPYCHKCCTSDLCNRGCDQIPITTVPPHPQITTTQATTTHEPVLVCYTCSATTDMASCLHAVPCLPGEICMIQEVGRTNKGELQYTASCEDRQLCSQYRALARAGKSSCHTCCDSHLCNTHCDAHPPIIQPLSVSTTHTTTQPITHKPVDGGWTGWMAWSSCTVTCGRQGIQQRSRSCSHPQPQYGGYHCFGFPTEFRVCTHLLPCPVDGGWSDWESWSSCSVTCGHNANQQRSRSCNHPAPKYGGQNCTGQSIDVKNCTYVPCPVDGDWTDWIAWSSCTVTCGKQGIQQRSRSCSHPQPQYGGHHCSGGTTDFRICTHLLPCPVDGGWSDWGIWSSCSVTCGHGGIHQKSRSCNNPPPEYGGRNCTGQETDVKNCTYNPCPVDGDWSSWGVWSSCSATCDFGQQARSRSCTNPPPQHHGQDCTGGATDIKVCQLKYCPVDGGWSSWSVWSSCTQSCGIGGQHIRTRTCTNPQPQHHGHDCAGESLEHQACAIQNCTSVAQNQLECYNCPITLDPSACPNTEVCEPGEVCMLHEIISPSSTAITYKASCERKLICDRVASLMTNRTQGQSKGHIFCTHCCNTTRCNNQCVDTMAPPTTLSPDVRCQRLGYAYVEPTGLCFKIYDSALSYYKATETCQQNGGTLAIIDSEFKWKLILFAISLQPQVAASSLYIGGSDTNNNGTYYWPDGTVFGYNNWTPGQPGHTVGKQHMSCVIVSKIDMTWQTDDCHAQRPFICTNPVH